MAPRAIIVLATLLLLHHGLLPRPAAGDEQAVRNLCAGSPHLDLCLSILLNRTSWNEDLYAQAVLVGRVLQDNSTIAMEHVKQLAAGTPPSPARDVLDKCLSYYEFGVRCAIKGLDALGLLDVSRARDLLLGPVNAKDDCHHAFDVAKLTYPPSLVGLDDADVRLTDVTVYIIDAIQPPRPARD